jgi:hypothetical protein
MLTVETAGNALPFEGVYVNYKKTGLTSDLRASRKPRSPLSKVTATPQERRLPLLSKTCLPVRTRRLVQSK